MAIASGKQMSVLTMNTLAFTVNFAVWTMFAIIGIGIKGELDLNETQFALLIATPILSGSLSRLPLGLLTERYGGRIVFLVQLIFVSIPTFCLVYASHYWHYLFTGFFVGIAGGAFAIGVTYTSAWFEPENQGTAMGIFGAGNIGVAITNIIAPLVMVSYGWRTIPLIYAAALIIIAVLFWLFTYTDPKHQTRKDNNDHASLYQQIKPLSEMRVWRFGLYYFFVFGGFIALALWLPKYYVGEYGVDLQTASYLTLAFIVPAAIIRAFGGWISDNVGARQVNWTVFWICIVCLFFLSYPASTVTVHGMERDIEVSIGINIYIFTLLIFIMGVAMGFGKAGVFRLIHDYYPNNMGSVCGAVGMIGGLGGFILPLLFGVAADLTNIRSSCFMLLYGVLGACMIWMYYAIKFDAYLERVREANESDFLAP